VQQAFVHRSTRSCQKYESLIVLNFFWIPLIWIDMSPSFTVTQSGVGLAHATVAQEARVARTSGSIRVRQRTSRFKFFSMFQLRERCLLCWYNKHTIVSICIYMYLYVSICIYSRLKFNGSCDQPMPCMFFLIKIFSLLVGFCALGSFIQALESWRRVTRQARFEKEKILGFIILEARRDFTYIRIISRSNQSTRSVGNRLK
jgi:hypothetical protein